MRRTHRCKRVGSQSISSRKVQLAFVSAMAVLLVTAGLSHRRSVQAVESDWWVRHAHEVLETLQDLALSVRTIESSAVDIVKQWEVFRKLH
jgi:hypothetical protein